MLQQHSVQMTVAQWEKFIVQNETRNNFQLCTLLEIYIFFHSIDECRALSFSLLPVLFVGRSRGMKGRCSSKQSMKAFIDMKPVSSVFVCVHSNSPIQPYLRGGKKINSTEIVI